MTKAEPDSEDDSNRRAKYMYIYVLNHRQQKSPVMTKY